MDKKVVILLATYQGSEFLRAQLNSLIEQTYTAWELFVRDDGSKDSTVQLLLEYAARDHRINVVQAAPGNLGSCGNFAYLLELSLTKLPAYVMFCDQDDVWLATKIAKTLEVMAETEKRCGAKTPVLIHTDLQVVDQDLVQIAASFEQYSKINPSSPQPLNRLLAQNYIFGCTMMLNASLVRAVVPVPKEAEGHDYWAALMAAALGEIVYYPAATILYRQHSSNVTGLKEGSLKNNLLRHFSQQGWSKTNKTVDNRLQQAARLRQRIQTQISPQQRALLTDFLSAASQGGLKAVLTARRQGIRRQGLIKTLVFYISLTRKKKALDLTKV